MMFELSPFGIVVPEWIIATATLVIWIGLFGVVLGLLRARSGRV